MTFKNNFHFQIKNKKIYLWLAYKDFWLFGRIIHCCRGKKCIHRHFPLTRLEKIIAFFFNRLPLKEKPLVLH
jgi:hypothetical protein